MKKEFECIVQAASPLVGHPKEVNILGRRITFTEEGVEYEADKRHAEEIIRDLGLQECRSVVTPWSGSDKHEGGVAAKLHERRLRAAEEAREELDWAVLGEGLEHFDKEDCEEDQEPLNDLGKN